MTIRRIIPRLALPAAKMKILRQAMKEGAHCLPGVDSVVMPAPRGKGSRKI